MTTTRVASEVRRIASEGADFERMIDISVNAYTGGNLFAPEARQRFAENVRRMDHESGVTLWGAFRAGELVGSMRLFDFTMRIHEAEGLIGGVGMVAVDLLQKKRGVARDLIAAYLAHYRERGATMAILHPFRPDFYRQMGFGYGAKMHQYRWKPADLPRGGARERVRPLGAGDAEALIACYDRVQARTHGLIRKLRTSVAALFEQHDARIVGYAEDGTLRGYLTFGFQKGREGILNELHVRELAYETPAALAGLLAFVQSQADQFAVVVFNTQEESFHFLPADPRNGTDQILAPPAYHETNTQGLGIMYRVIDVPGLFALLRDHDFGGQSCTLRLTVRDSFLPANDGTTTIRFAAGRASVVEGGLPDVAIALDVADFSSLVMGTVRFRALLDYGRATIDDPAGARTIDRLFATERQPICTTGF